MFSDFITPIKSNIYEARLVKNEKELRAYQKLRYNYLLLDAFPDRNDEIKLDLHHGYDADCAQLCVFYNNPNTGEEELVGGYLLMRFKNEHTVCTTSSEYDLTKLLVKHRYEILELSRAVVHPDHRNGAVLRLLWSGIMAYAQTYNLRYLIGIVNFKGLDPTKYDQALGYLYHNYLMPDDIMVSALPGSHRMNVLKSEKIARDEAISQIPSILKGYLLQGAEVGNGMFIDRVFQSVDVFVILDLTKHGRFPLK